MPTTYNGIGTHYYGKANLQTRAGTCRSCGRNVQLQSYDTRLWFVIVFIPIIPLGRKHIIDSCPVCRRHYVSDLEKWETARQLETSGAMDKFRSDPTPENAIAAHQQLLGFNQVNEAAELQKTMLAKFPDNAKIFAYLASAQEHLGRRDEADTLYQRALELRPDMPEARVGVARGYMRAGRLDDARKMLDFLEKPGAAQLYSLEPLETLARAFQRANRHDEALDLFEKLLAELPKLAEHAGFRKAVKLSEKEPGRSILPKQKFSLKRMFQSSGGKGSPVLQARTLLVFGILFALVALAFAASNEFIRHHRHIYVLNGYDKPATVDISGHGALQIAKGMQTITLPEGHYHASISGPVKQEVDFEVREDYFSRWSSDSVWILNVGGGAMLEENVVVYSHNPVPGTSSIHTGKTFEHLTGVTHPFKTLPKSVEVPEGGSKTLTEIELFTGDASDVFDYYETKRSLGEAMTFAETWLRAHPEDNLTLRTYAETAQQQKQGKRLDAFLRAGLTNRPVQIEFHRLYQGLHDRAAGHDALVGEYNGLLQAEPTNSALLYLRGRLETDRGAANGYFNRAVEQDPMNPYPVFALAYDRAAAGDWNGAKKLMVRTTELDPHDLGFKHVLFLARLMTGEAPAIEQESRKNLLARGWPDYVAEIQLLDALAEQNKRDEVVAACNEFVNLFRARNGGEAAAVVNVVQYHASYVAGDFDKLKSEAQNDSSPAGRTAQVVALIEQGHPDEAAALLSTDDDDDDKATIAFALSLVYRQQGNKAAAASWRSRGIEALDRGSMDSVVAANLLKRNIPPTLAEAQSIIVQPQLKAVMFAMLSQEYPQSRAELAGVARNANAEHAFPYQLVRRVASAGK
jgi:tetratricopeptide (TPR) repeat protein